MGLIASTVLLLIDIIQMLLILRAVLSWIMPTDANRFTVFLYNITEPIIMPIRRLLWRFDSVRSFPIDISYYVTFIVLFIIERIIRW